MMYGIHNELKCGEVTEFDVDPNSEVESNKFTSEQ